MLARIYRPAKTAMQSGTAKTEDWVLEFAPAEARVKDPLMGWTGSSDTQSQVQLKFETVDAAVHPVIQTIQMGLPMARIELVDAATARAFNSYAGAAMPEMPHLMVEFHGTPAAVAEQSEMFGAIADEMGG